MFQKQIADVKKEYIKHKSKIPMFAGMGLGIILVLWVVSKFKDEDKKETTDGQQN